MEEYPLPIGPVIVKLRKNRGLSQERLSIESGVDRRYLSDLENDRRNPSLDVLHRLSSYFQLSLSQFFNLVETHQHHTDITQYLCDAGCEDAIVFRNPDFAKSFVGVSHDGQAIYSFNNMIAELIEEGMTEEEAVDFIDFNTIRAIPYMGEKAPIILY